MEEIHIEKIDWDGLEYEHKEHTTDWFWSVGLITIAIFIVLIWIKNYLFAIFILLSGASLSLFSIRHPKNINYSIETEGFTMGKDKYVWEKIKGFDIIKREGQDKLLIKIDKYFLPVYTIPIPSELTSEIKNSLIQVVPPIKLKESESMMFVEKLGL